MIYQHNFPRPGLDQNCRQLHTMDACGLMKHIGNREFPYRQMEIDMKLHQHFLRQ